MKKTITKLLALVLAVLMALSLAACGAKDSGAADKVELPVAVTVNTDEETLGAALLKLGVVAGDDSEYGLYVKTVNGETADYDTDGSYWAFYIDGEYAMAGVDYTAPEAGKTYAFKVEQAAG